MVGIRSFPIGFRPISQGRKPVSFREGNVSRFLIPQVSANSVNSSKGLRNRMTTCSCVFITQVGVRSLIVVKQRHGEGWFFNVAASNDLPAFFGWKKG